jgi:hypothetical protein
LLRQEMHSVGHQQLRLSLLFWFCFFCDRHCSYYYRQTKRYLNAAVGIAARPMPKIDLPVTVAHVSKLSFVGILNFIFCVASEVAASSVRWLAECCKCHVSTFYVKWLCSTYRPFTEEFESVITVAVGLLRHMQASQFFCSHFFKKTV